MIRLMFAMFVFSMSSCSAQVWVVGGPGGETSSGGYSKPEENKFYDLINSFRRELKLPRLSVDARLNESARKHSTWMMGMNYLTHVGPTLTGSSYTRVIYEGVDASATIGENIARGNFDARATFKQWLLSPAHLLGMIEPVYTHIGISRSDCDEDYEGSCFWTTDFAELGSQSQDDEREFTVEEVAQAAEMVLGPLGSQRAEISIEEPVKQSRWQRLKNKIVPGQE